MNDAFLGINSVFWGIHSVNSRHRTRAQHPRFWIRFTRQQIKFRGGGGGDFPTSSPTSCFWGYSMSQPYPPQPVSRHQSHRCYNLIASFEWFSIDMESTFRRKCDCIGGCIHCCVPSIRNVCSCCCICSGHRRRIGSAVVAVEGLVLVDHEITARRIASSYNRRLTPCRCMSGLTNNIYNTIVS